MNFHTSPRNKYVRAAAPKRSKGEINDNDKNAALWLAIRAQMLTLHPLLAFEDDETIAPALVDMNDEIEADLD